MISFVPDVSPPESNAERFLGFFPFVKARRDLLPRRPVEQYFFF